MNWKATNNERTIWENKDELSWMVIESISIYEWDWFKWFTVCSWWICISQPISEYINDNIK